MLNLSLRDRDRLVVLHKVPGGPLTACRGAEILGLSERQFRRVRRRFEAEGDGAVVHRHRERPPNNTKLASLRARVLERASEPQFHDFRPTLLAEHLSRDLDIGALNAHTLRRWLIAEGRWKVKKR